MVARSGLDLVERRSATQRSARHSFSAAPKAAPASQAVAERLFIDLKPVTALERFPSNPDHILRQRSSWRTPQARTHPATRRSPATAPPCPAPLPCEEAPSASKTRTRSGCVPPKSGPRL